MTMEIKQGDKVRVSKDAPREIIKNEVIPTAREFTVTAVGGFYAEIKLNGALLPTYFSIPAKYLVKVDAEAKEPTAPTIKVGDRVRHKRLGVIVKICNIKDNKYIALGDGLKTYTFRVDDLELVQPTEQTEAEYTKTKGDTQTFPITFDLTDSYWDAYTADLAKEIALKVANKKMDNYPEEIGTYAVRVAKAVVEGLKGK